MSNPLLFISAHLPVKNSRQAGQKTAWRNLCWLAERYSVHLIAFRSEGDLDEPLGAIRAVCEQVRVVDVTRKSRLLGLLRSPHIPLTVAARSNPHVRQQISVWSDQNQFKRVHIEWSQVGQYLNQLPDLQNRTLYIHDVITQWAERKAIGKFGWFWKLEAQRNKRWEAHIYAKCSRLYVPSRKDKELVGLISPSANRRISLLPLHFDIYRPKTPRDYGGPLRILFWGALGRSENADAARWLCREVVPRLRAKGCAFKLVFAGSNPPADLNHQQSRDIEVTGFLDNPSEQFERAHLAVTPLFQGAGVKVKVLECLAAGLPVLTTEIGSEGIEADASDGLYTLPPEATTFANLIISLAEDRIRVARLGLAAAQWGHRCNQDHHSILLD